MGTVEVVLKPASVAAFASVRSAVHTLLERRTSSGVAAFASDEFLREHVESVRVEDDDDGDDESHDGVVTQLPIHVFKLSDEPPAEETAEDDESVATCSELVLPSRSLDGLWESLVYDSAVKRTVLAYATTAMRFSDSRVNPHIISWNRYPSAFLLEINTHSLFSKIQELVDDGEALVCVLIDEVESLTAARKAALSGSEPSDAIRVVNAVLTQLDALKSHSNVLVLTTSNITEAIDIAFVDRADIKQYIGLPSVHARYEILRSCVDELQRVQILEPSTSPILSFVRLMAKRGSRKRLAEQMDALMEDAGDADGSASAALLLVAEMADGFSGRALRKLPFQAHAFFVQSRSTSMAQFIEHLGRTVTLEIEQRQRLATA
ncbi:hypothetical protein PybrP1_001079 [[Pythium] brassicae (nom. inval.)]|nr:hypothetical protein PybrP1_001079 [[Pythium] brassicae (nom. inval.)]